MTFTEEISEAYFSILRFWMVHAPDDQRGGFFGKIDNNNHADAQAPRGAVLYARILWSFSAAFRVTRKQKYLDTAHRAFDYITKYFADARYGGVYWSVDADGKPLETKKQVYAQAFAIYAMSEYFQASGDGAARSLAIEWYRLLQKHSYDNNNGGYIEAFSREWEPVADLRLSDKDANEKKTMNTHLHLLEAYTGLYAVWSDPELRGMITQLLQIFSERIINPENHHLVLFFDEDWNVKSDTISYGHDIEASWLLLEAAKALHDDMLIKHFSDVAVRLADAAIEGIDGDGGLWYAYEPAHRMLVREKHWWPQAEVLVGFINAWKITGNRMYYDTAVSNWHFIQRHLIDSEKGEWFWGVKEDYSVMNEDKAGFWKCPYHNSRACIEVMKRLRS